MSRFSLSGVAALVVALACGCTQSDPVYTPTGVGPGGAGPIAVTGVGGQAGTADPNACVSAGGRSGPTFPVDLGPTVTRAPVPPPPISGGTLLVLDDGSAAVASDPERDLVSVVDLGTRALRLQVTLEVGDEPGRLVEDSVGRVHVVLRRGGAVVTFDPGTGAVLDRQSVCAAPRGLAYELATDRIHVACAGGELVSLPASGGPAVRSVALERDLRDVVVNSDGKLLVSTFRRAEVLVLDDAGAVTSRLRPPTRLRKAVMPATQTLTPAVGWRMVAMVGGGVVMAHQRGVDDPLQTGGGAYAGGRGCGAIVESAVTMMAPGQTVAVAPGIAGSVLPVDVAVSPVGDKVALVSAGTTGVPVPIPAPPVMEMPVVSGNGQDCIIGGSGYMPTTGQAVAVSYVSETAMVVQTRDPAQLWFTSDGAAVSLSTDARTDTGHKIFHVNAGGGVACASCHPEGGEDARVWNFACLGQRRTQSIRGGISGTEPFHWDGDMKDFTQLVHEVFEGRMGGPVLTDDQRGALLGWIDAIPSMPGRPVDDAVQRGAALFTSAAVGCSACHAGQHFTNNATVDVGTGQPLQVPSLRNVAWRAPFLHNGCAATLADRFGSCATAKHGNTEQLTAADISDLVAYLESL